ncbi:hypothetical protein BC941DRAFT_474636 [Chlamydoabsidia padenii]|nr:hypothetical protein BC941DRAFT_474636 [Chlamydoabsidia padenii]
MQLLYLCTLAVFIGLLDAVVNTDDEPMIQLHHKDGRWTLSNYNKCIHVDKTKGTDVDLIYYPRRTTCNHYQDAECTIPTTEPTIFEPGYALPAIEDGYGKCQIATD